MYILVVHVLMYFSIKIIVLDMLSYYLYSNQNKIHDNSVILMRNVSKELLETNTTHMYYTYVLHYIEQEDKRTEIKMNTSLQFILFFKNSFYTFNLVNI